MITNRTITDEQIRELRDSIIAEVERAGDAGVRIDAREALADCNDALDPDLTDEAARARCAEIHNARIHNARKVRAELCPTCGAGPLHATESDDLGRCAACASKAAK